MKSDKISSKELFNAIDQIYEEKGITKEYLIESLQMALEAAYKKNYDTTEDIIVDINEQSIKVYAVKTVVENVEDKNKEISLPEAKTISKRAKIGEGVQLLAGSIVNTEVVIGDNTIINTKSSILP